MLFDRAVALFGLGVTLIVGLYTFAPDNWPKIPPMATAGGMAIGLLILGVGCGLLIADFRKANRDAFDIEFDPADPRFVRIEADRVRYFVGFRNLLETTIGAPSLRAPRTTFTETMLTPSDPHNWGHPVDAMLICVFGALDPGGLEFIELFGLPLNGPFVHDHLLAQRHRFSLEARGRDAKTRRVDFEYDPDTFPRIRKC